MLRTVQAVVEADGTVRVLEPLRLHGAHRAVLTILDDGEPDSLSSTALLSEVALATDWTRPEEDAAWAYLQPGR
jgi:hypothetical protein